ncbi:MAG TPA: NAD-dependent epimerase/dehydratase family protein, partial [Urbifossiella sp.]|nr:NAD-dependent epimerase/dehydratase family protein [Urbifossiella sp.]
NRKRYVPPPPPAPPAADALVFGCGYLGRRVAARWAAGGRRVAAVTRRNADGLRALGLDPVAADVTDPASLTGLPRAATVLYAVGLDRAAGRSMRDVYVGGLANVLAALPAGGRFIYVSSTGVYGQTDGGWVDETSPTEPREEAGVVVLEAERRLRDRRPDAVVLRLAGLYGPDRLLRKQPVLKGEPLVGDADKWLNLVHVADAAAAVVAAADLAAPGATYTVADDAPTPRRAFYTLLAERLSAPPAAFDHRPEPGAPNRRVSNRAAKADLGWAPRFPSFREGLPAAVAESTP